MAEETLAEIKNLQKGKALPEASENLWSRRSFFSLAGWAGFLGSIGVLLLGFTRFMFPRVLFEPSPIFKAGFPEDYTIGKVSNKWKQDQRVWIYRDSEALYAIFARCTHLGCTPNWLASEGKFKCPCHGSGFTIEGIHFEGPAPRPLERLKIGIASDGQIVIDKSKKYRQEKGEWGKPGSFLRA
jgi:cytochrome b6-f complex iron-sulfur subunit